VDSELPDFAQRLVEMVVDRPEAVVILTRPTDVGVELTIRVAPEEIGMVIGRGGRTIQAIRQLVIACGAKLGMQVRLDVEEPGTASST
jgi:uncharacterized protein